MLLEKVKIALRIDGDYLDEEITDLIEACKLDLKISGVNVIEEDDPLIIRAIITYSRAFFDVTNPNMEKLGESYNNIKRHLALSSEYGGDKVEVE